ncbi:unnamed protein product [Tetraodon nigroviridis]|uniref:(spotted green pufferfish) hypothetical protein n=1 Tax=Tetraodon nigroviridis TaxID=99883 RepID=Q4SW93_TETNG|nr:unnamed protein product [Tetraodon nigroviridis]
MCFDLTGAGAAPKKTPLIFRCLTINRTYLRELV